MGAGRYSSDFLAAIDAGLKVRPEERPASMFEFRKLFVSDVGFAAPPVNAGDTAMTPAGDASEPTQVLPYAGLWRPEAGVHSTSAWSAAGGRSRHVAWSAATLSVAVLALAIWWSLRPSPEPQTVTQAVPTTPPTRPAVTTATGSVAVPAAQPFSVLSSLQDIVEGADPSIRVSAGIDKAALVIGKDSMRFRVKSSEAGYVYAFLGGTDKRHFHLLFPNRLDKLNRIESGVELVLPRKSWEINAAGPPGTNHLVVLVSRHKRNLNQVPLRETEEPIPEFDLAQAERLWNQRAAGGPSPFVGEPVCPTPDCSGAYGAAMLAVDEVAVRN
jgi:Domain of unknown function (DUF4384)